MIRNTDETTTAVLTADSADARELLRPESLTPRALRATLGGLWSWADIRIAPGWRIQMHYSGQRFRLLDGRSRLWAEGGELDCLDVWRKVGAERVAHQEPRPTVLLLHGVLRTRHCMNRLGSRLQQAGYRVHNLSYPSTRWTIDQSAEVLRRLVSALQGVSRLHLVGYSMGGLVMRRALADGLDASLGRAVFIGTPNRGAEKADPFVTWPLYRWLFGPAGVQLSTLPGHGVIHRLPDTVPMELGIIAGGTGGRHGYLPMLEGDNDFTVTVESTRMPGMQDFALVGCDHARLPQHDQTCRLVTRFLDHGHFGPVMELDRQEVVKE